MIIIICNSHRARQKVESILEKLPPLFSFEKETGRGRFEVTNKQWEKVSTIKGVQRSSLKRADLMECWTGKDGGL